MHLAIIMDGNRRWAAQRGLASMDGYAAGVDALRRVTAASAKRGVNTLTVFGFSTENWQRGRGEVNGLMRLCSRAAHRYIWDLARQGVRVRVIGELSGLPQFVQHALEALVWNTARNSGLSLQLALNYSGREEILRAVRAVAREVAQGDLQAHDIDERRLRRHFFAPDVPDPDLLIRTGGEHRISNFLLYQLAYTEIWTTPLLWPDFQEATLDEALRSFGARHRRFGT